MECGILGMSVPRKSCSNMAETKVYLPTGGGGGIRLTILSKIKIPFTTKLRFLLTAIKYGHQTELCLLSQGTKLTNGTFGALTKHRLNHLKNKRMLLATSL